METFSLIDSRFDSRSSLSSLPGRTPISSANNAEEIGVRPGKDETTSSPLDDHFKSLLRPNTHLDYIQVILVRGGGGWRVPGASYRGRGWLTQTLSFLGPCIWWLATVTQLSQGFILLRQGWYQFKGRKAWLPVMIPEPITSICSSCDNQRRLRLKNTLFRTRSHSNSSRNIPVEHITMRFIRDHSYHFHLLGQFCEVDTKKAARVEMECTFCPVSPFPRYHNHNLSWRRFGIFFDFWSSGTMIALKNSFALLQREGKVAERKYTVLPKPWCPLHWRNEQEGSLCKSLLQ